MAADFDRDEAERIEKPWRADPRYGGMSDESARLSWEATQKTKSAVSNGTGNGFDDQDDQEEECRPPAFSDESLALIFADQYANKLRYVAKWSRWMIWDGKCWAEDTTLHAFNLARTICRAAASKCNKGKTATMLASAKTVAAVDRLARADRRLAATVDQWDADPWLLNTPNGTINLQTGGRHQSQATDYITQCTAVAPGECPLWLKFLDRITNGDRALQDYIQNIHGIKD
jgi:putative DNA primase/helicase